MISERKKLYLILTTACAGGLLWIGWQWMATGSHTLNTWSICIFRHVTGIPCPSCGSTRSVISLLNGDILESIWINPIGLILTFIMLTVPLWLAFDLIRQSDTLLRVYKNAEQQLRRPVIATSFILLITANWIWNIIKDL